jgi:hypothetical protein
VRLPDLSSALFLEFLCLGFTCHASSDLCVSVSFDLKPIQIGAAELQAARQFGLAGFT